MAFHIHLRMLLSPSDFWVSPVQGFPDPVSFLPLEPHGPWQRYRAHEMIP